MNLNQYGRDHTVRIPSDDKYEKLVTYSDHMNTHSSNIFRFIHSRANYV